VPRMFGSPVSSFLPCGERRKLLVYSCDITRSVLPRIRA
jgi:hypothetical protein